MKNQYSELNELGWNDWFAQRAECKPTDTIARVAAVDRDQLLLVDQSGHFRAKLGRQLFVPPSPDPMSCRAWATGCVWRSSQTTTLG